MGTCFACGEPLPYRDRIGRQEVCPACGADCHACRNCRFFDPSRYNACGEPQAERVLEKERRNFCDFFAPGKAAAPPPASVRDRLEGLFRK